VAPWRWCKHQSRYPLSCAEQCVTSHSCGGCCAPLGMFFSAILLTVCLVVKGHLVRSLPLCLDVLCMLAVCAACVVCAGPPVIVMIV
jgi:hypothetical protein